MATTGSIAELMRAVDAASSSDALLKAVEAVAALQSEEAVPMLVAALGYNNPGVAVASVDGLIAIGEPSVEPLLALLDDVNYGARAWAIRALAGIGDPRGLTILLAAAKDDFALSVRRAAARGLGTILWEMLPLEERFPAQLDCLGVLLSAARDLEWVVRYAAVAGLQNLGRSLATDQPDQIPFVLTQLQTLTQEESTSAVQARMLLAQESIQSF
jgi:phycocyanobilin lyase subunit beta